MPTLAWNKKYWDAGTDWTDRGEGWSGPWGTPQVQWYSSLYPRIHQNLPAGTILEIACGYGRWTNFLRAHCERLIGVDLVAQCVEACRHRFAAVDHLSFVQNDGRSLDFVEDNSVDFIFSFDSLVHVDDTVLRGYLSQFQRILRRGGAAFLHHSNLGAYPIQARLLYTPKVRRVFSIAHLIERQHHNREPRMSAARMRTIATDSGLSVVGQECVTWGTRRMLIDCLTTLRVGSGANGMKPIANRNFMREANNWRRLGVLYANKHHENAPDVAEKHGYNDESMIRTMG
jgi:ubiquinone/menaquinone biosynthesis C-methylase UbiE